MSSLGGHADELYQGERFEFGANWRRFLTVLDEQRIQLAVGSLIAMLGVDSLEGKRFLDVGSGSGLFSLAARRLGARVYSFDYDPRSVACTTELKARFCPDDANWVVEQGSVLDPDYLRKLGQYDVVYSWGVLHHTGRMWEALDNVTCLVKEGGRLFISIYNHQGRATILWERIKRYYCRSHRVVRGFILAMALVRLWGPTTVRDLCKLTPGRTWREYSRGLGTVGRGMSPWYDLVDWVGGYPFEAAKPEQVMQFFRGRGFCLDKMTTSGGGRGCNEFVMTRLGAHAWQSGTMLQPA